MVKQNLNETNVRRKESEMTLSPSSKANDQQHDYQNQPYSTQYRWDNDHQHCKHIKIQLIDYNCKITKNKSKLQLDVLAESTGGGLLSKMIKIRIDRNPNYYGTIYL